MSLAPLQVVARIFQLADPVRKGAADWLPLVAVVLGAVAATTEGAEGGGDEGTLIAIRVLSIAVLLAALARGAVGERNLFKAARAFPRLQEGGFYQPIKSFYSWWRLGWVVAFDIALLTAFGLAIFLCWWAWVLAVVAGFVFAVLEFRWRRPERKKRRKRPPATMAGS